MHALLAEEFDQLEVIVHECTDVPDCEYVELPDGALCGRARRSMCPLHSERIALTRMRTTPLTWCRGQAPRFRKAGGACFTGTPTKVDPVRPGKSAETATAGATQANGAGQGAAIQEAAVIRAIVNFLVYRGMTGSIPGLRFMPQFIASY